MRFIHRALEKQIVKAAHNFPSVLLTDPRRAGKTTIFKKLFPKAEYYLLEDPDLIARLRSDPKSFLNEIHTPVILDEIQNVPELFNYIRTKIDQFPHRANQWYLTGSQEAPLMRKVSESMAGRVAIFQLLPLSYQEYSKVSIFHGGFPEILTKPKTADIWFRSYIQTYLERDVRAISSIKDLATFRRFLSLLASRTSNILNKTDLSSPLGVSVPTITEWISILEITGQIILTPPFYENFGRRLIKSPKVYFVDTGLLCYLLGIESEKMLMKSNFLGAVFEGFIASEIIKYQINNGKKKELYYFRDQQGVEVDFLIPTGNGKLTLLEVKATRTPRPESANTINRLKQSISSRYQIKAACVHLPLNKSDKNISTLRPGVHAISINNIPNYL